MNFILTAVELHAEVFILVYYRSDAGFTSRGFYIVSIKNDGLNPVAERIRRLNPNLVYLDQVSILRPLSQTTDEILKTLTMN